MTNYKDKLHEIKAFVFDFDGVMTDGSVWTYGDRETVRAGNSKDGYAIHYSTRQGYRIAIISGATTQSIDNRMEALGVSDIYTGCSNKLQVFQQFLDRYNLHPAQVVCMGDDIPDYEMMRHAGVAACPADAATEILQIADYISPFPGGRGCVRDIIEQTLRLQGTWFQQNALEW